MGWGNLEVVVIVFPSRVEQEFSVSVLHASSIVESLIFKIYLAVMARKMLLKMTSILQKKLTRLQVVMLLKVTLNIQLCMSATLLQRQVLLILAVSLFSESMSCSRVQIRWLCL